MSQLFRSIPFLIGLGLAIAWLGLATLYFYIEGRDQLHLVAAILCGFPNDKGPAAEACVQAKLAHATMTGYWKAYAADKSFWAAGPALLLLGGGAAVALLQGHGPVDQSR